MRKNLRMKLSLHRETLRALETAALQVAQGGATAQTCGNPCSNICTNICTEITYSPACQHNTTK